MSETIAGGCLCGEVRYQYVGPIGPANYCHCRDCRRVTGGPFNIGVKLETAGFQVVRGQVKAYLRRADSGNDISRSFCSACGSPLFTSSPRHPEHVFVKAGSLDDPTVVRPVDQIWTDSAVTWARIDPSLPAYPRGRR